MEPQNQNNLNNQNNAGNQPNSANPVNPGQEVPAAEPAPFQTAGQPASQPTSSTVKPSNGAEDQPSPSTTFTPQQDSSGQSAAQEVNPPSQPVAVQPEGPPAAQPQTEPQPASVPQPPTTPPVNQTQSQPAEQPAAPVQSAAAQQPAAASTQANKVQNLKNKLNGPNKSTTVKIIAGLVALSILGVVASFALGALAKDSVVAQFDELKVYQDEDGYEARIPSSWQVDAGSVRDTFAQDPTDAYTNVGMNIIRSGKISGYAEMSDTDKDSASLGWIDNFEQSLIELFDAEGPTEVVTSSTDNFANTDRTVYVELKANMQGQTYIVANSIMIFNDGSTYTMNVIVPETAWNSVQDKVKEIFNGFKLA